MSDVEKPTGATGRTSRLGDLYASAARRSEAVGLGDMLAGKDPLAEGAGSATNQKEPAAPTDETLRKMVVGLARLAGAKDVEAVVRDFERNRPLAKVVGKLLNAYRPENRGRKKMDHLEKDYALILELRRKGFKGDELYQKAADLVGRPVHFETMRRYHRAAVAERRNQRIVRILTERN